jgi:hypothetical protein
MDKEFSRETGQKRPSGHRLGYKNNHDSSEVNIILVGAKKGNYTKECNDDLPKAKAIVQNMPSVINAVKGLLLTRRNGRFKRCQRLNHAND